VGEDVHPNIANVRPEFADVCTEVADVLLRDADQERSGCCGDAFLFVVQGFGGGQGGGFPGREPDGCDDDGQ
jgi:hypothetical protein